MFSEGCLLPSGEAEIRRAAGGLGGEASGEAEMAPPPGRPRTSRAPALGRVLGLLEPGEDLGVQT